jgi:hypothetical protein
MYPEVRYYPGICVEGLMKTTQPEYCHFLWRATIDEVLDSSPDLLDIFIQRVILLLYIYTNVSSHIFTAVARSRLPTEDVLLTLDSRTFTSHTYQLLTATAHN